VRIQQAREVQIWTACPQDVQAGQWLQLNGWLDPLERLQCLRFRRDDDRRAYVLAHALRRLAVARALAVPASCVSFSSLASGQPVLAAPRNPGLYFSHAHSRSLVACAVTRIGPVGLDVEPLVRESADMALLRGMVASPETGPAPSAGEATARFFFYWTLLEAYWKAQGSGLSFDHPALHCHSNSTGEDEGWFTVSLAPAGQLGAPGAALAAALQAPPGCAMTLVLAQAGGAAPGHIRLTYRTPVFDRDFAPREGRRRQPCPPERACAPAHAAFRRNPRQAALPSTPFARA